MTGPNVGAGAIGYNVANAKKLADDVVDIHTQLKQTITSEWDALLSIMEREWVGEDEQNFEDIFSKRICTLYVNSYNLTKSCAEDILRLINSWSTFQHNNVLSSSSNGGGMASIVEVNIPALTDEEIVKPNSFEIAETDTRGLMSANSYSTIMEAVTTYVNAIKQKANDLFESINSSTAFFGEQSAKITSYIKAYNDAVAEVNVAVKDLHDQLEEVNTSYTTADSDVVSEMETGATKVETDTQSELDSLGDVRWTA